MNEYTQEQAQGIAAHLRVLIECWHDNQTLVSYHSNDMKYRDEWQDAVYAADEYLDSLDTPGIEKREMCLICGLMFAGVGDMETHARFIHGEGAEGEVG